MPKGYQVGLFDKPGKQYKSIIRFSNAVSLVGPDIDNTGKRGSRGMAVKVFNVSGKVLSNDRGGHNQDFLMINQPNFAFANTEDYLRLHRISDTQGDKADGFLRRLDCRLPISPIPKNKQFCNTSQTRKFMILGWSIDSASDRILGFPHSAREP